MFAAYGVDVLDPAVSCRRVRALLEHMPPWALHGGDQWTTEAELLAALVDSVAYLTWVTLRANGAKHAPKPKPVPRPRTGSLVLSGAARSAVPAAAKGDSAPAKAGNWAEAAKMLGGMKGVEVVYGD